MSTTVNVSNIKLDNDLSGTLDNPYVVSVSNVKFGTLKVENGGLGLYSLPYGSILLGNSTLPPMFLSGSDGDFLSWSDSSGSWISKKTNNVSSLDISLQNNDIFSLIDLSSGSTKIYNFTFNDHDQRLFLASPENTNGSASFRAITSQDLPDIISNKQLLDTNIIGLFTGSANIDNIYGDGSGLYNLTSSQIVDFNNRVQNILNDQSLTFNNLNILTASIGQASILSGNFFGEVSGTLLGDGSGIENLSTSAISDIYDYVNTFFSGGVGVTINSGTISINCDAIQITSSDPNLQINNSGDVKIFSLNKNLSIPIISSSLMTSTSVSANNIFSNVVSGNIYGNFNGKYSGPGNFIDSGSILNSALQFDYININNNRISLGDSVQISGISSVTSSNNNIITELSGDVAKINLNTVLDVEYLTADYISSSQFMGDGSGLVNINLSNIGSIDGLIPVDEQNIIFNNGVLSLSQSVNIENIYSSKGYIVELDTYTVSGNGFNLTNLNANNLINTASFINSIVSTIPTSPIRQFNSNTQFNIGDVVCLSQTGLAKASSTSKDLSTPIGIVTNTSGNNVYIQTNGNVEFKNTLFNQITGSIIYLGQDADGVQYSSIPINCYAFELGTLTSTNKIEINFKKLWKVS